MGQTRRMADPLDPKASRAPLSALRPLIPFALAYKGRVAAALASLVAASAATLVLPLAVRRVIDYGFAESSGHLIDAYFGVLILVVGLLALSSALRYWFVITLGERVVADLRSAVFTHLTSLDPSFFDRSRSGEIVSRLNAEIAKALAN